MNLVNQEVARKWGYMQEVRSFRVISSVDRFEGVWLKYFKNFVIVKGNDIELTEDRQLFTRCSDYGAHVIAMQFKGVDLVNRYALMNLKKGVLREKHLQFLEMIRDLENIRAILVPFEKADPLHTQMLAEILETRGIECAITDQMDEEVRHLAFDPLENCFFGARVIRIDVFKEQILSTHGF